MHKHLVFVLLIIAGFVSVAHAESFDSLETRIISVNDDVATVQISWTELPSAVNYEIGCVSCKPKIIESTSINSIELEGITAFPNSNDVMLYIIAYDGSDEIIAAKQIIIKIN